MRISILLVIFLSGCVEYPATNPADSSEPDLTPQFSLTRDQTHNKFSSAIPPVLHVPSGAIVEVETEEASDGQLLVDATIQDVIDIDFEPIHPLTGPVYVEGAQPGDVLAVTIHKIEIGDYGWTAIVPNFGFLSDTFTDPYIKTFSFDEGAEEADFGNGITIPLRPFAGVMGVAPETAEMLSTIPPRANGGNMDDPNMVEGTTVYFPVFVEGALFSIGDTHAAQGLGEVCGTAIEAPMNIVYEVNVIKGKKIKEPQYETADYYATTGFAPTIDEAARKATLYMVDHLVDERGMSREDAYALVSLAGDLKIAEVVDVPNMLVTMHVPHSIFGS